VFWGRRLWLIWLEAELTADQVGGILEDWMLVSLAKNRSFRWASQRDSLPIIFAIALRAGGIDKFRALESFWRQPKG
jgi:hypothetical protein